MKQRFKNYGLWVAVFSFIPLLLQACGVDIMPAQYEELVNGLLSILVIAGILNNPSKTNGYKDTK